MTKEVAVIIKSETVSEGVQSFYAYLGAHRATQDPKWSEPPSKVFGSFMNEVWAIVQSELKEG